MNDKYPPYHQLSKMIRRAKLEMPFSDFEDIVMERIEKESVQSRVFSRDRRLSMFFFLLGTTLGMVLNSILQKAEYSFLGMSSELTHSLFQFAFVLVFLLILESNLRVLTRIRKSQANKG